MLWSFMLYVVLMLLINWEEVHNVTVKKNEVTFVDKDQSQMTPDRQAVTPANISSPASATTFFNLLKAISSVL